jgi:hypothetical protein
MPFAELIAELLEWLGLGAVSWTGLGAALVSILTFLWEVTKIAPTLAVIAIAIELLFDPKGKQRVGNLLSNLTGGAIAVASPLLTALEGDLVAIVKQFTTAFQNSGPGLSAAVAPAISDFMETNFNAVSDALLALGPSTPDNAVTRASLQLGTSFGLGISSAAVTAAFEALLPEKLNTLNGIGPMLASLAGFAEVSRAIRDPLYAAAFGKSAEYKYRSQFKPEFPSERDATTWYARGLITQAQLDAIWAVSGLKSEYEQPYLSAAYRPLSPFLLRLAENTGAISDADLMETMTYAGMRPVDQQRMVALFDAAAILPYRNQVLSALKIACEKGTIPLSELASQAQSIGIIAAAIPLIQQEVAWRRIEQLAELYRKSVTELYKTGQLADADYVPSLTAAGIDQADAEAHYQIDSAAKLGKALAAEARAAAALTKQQQHQAMNSAVAQFREGTLDEPALLAALLAIPIDPSIATFVTSIQAARLAGNVRYVYGLTLPRHEAEVLREQVAALALQTRAKLVSYDDALAALKNYGIPDANALALAALWTATHTAAADVGVKEPR